MPVPEDVALCDTVADTLAVRDWLGVFDLLCDCVRLVEPDTLDVALSLEVKV